MPKPNTDLTTREANDERKEIEREIGIGAEIYVDLNRYGEDPISVAVYPNGVTREVAFRLKAETFRDLFAQTRAKWEEFRTTHVRRTIDQMALEIIRLTDAQGEATDAALRALSFHGGDVKRYGARAAERATEMAGRGPFTLKTLGGDNGAPKDDEEDAA